MVDFSTLAVKGCAEKLKCDICTNYLSYFPISVRSNGRSVCGRCTNPSLSCYQDQAFETIAQFLKFPCRFRGCFRELYPKDVPSHEDQCPFRIVTCIVNNPATCPWKGSVLDLSQHCHEKHSNLILQNEFNINMFKTEEYDHLVEQEDRLLVFTRKFDSTTKTLSVAVHNNQYDLDSESCEYQLSVKQYDKTVLLDLKSTSYKEKRFVQFCLKSMESEDKKVATAKLSAGKTPKAGDKVDAIYSKLSSFLTCHICYQTAVPPIYVHTNNGDLMCATCYSITADCCAGLYVKSPLVLGEIANLLDYKCKNDSCSFTSKYVQVQEHELRCVHAPKRRCLQNVKLS